MNRSSNPIFIEANKLLHPLYTRHINASIREYVLLKANLSDSIVSDFPRAFDDEILPILKRDVDSLRTYQGKGLRLIEDPSQDSRFLWTLLHDVGKINFKENVSQNAITLLEMYGGPREIRSLAELAAYAGLERSVGFGGSVKVAVQPDDAWHRISKLYFDPTNPKE